MLLRSANGLLLQLAYTQSMGSCKSTAVNQKSRAIDRQLQMEQVKLKKTVKLLLLGAGESGKSTILKQMRILHTQYGFTDFERKQIATLIRAVAVRTLLRIVDAMVIADIDFKDVDRHDDAWLLGLGRVSGQDAAHLEDVANLSDPEAVAALQRIWNDSSYRKFYHRYEKKHENGNYFFFNHLDRICQTNYLPTEEDILRLRIPTTGVTEIRFSVGEAQVRAVDVGGQRSERRKWIHCFDDVAGVLFLTALSDYDQAMREDGITNRMRDSIMLFESVCNSVWFTNAAIVLFLNKKDIFAQKIKAVPLISYFPDYKGQQDFTEAVDFIKKKFLQTIKQQRSIYSHLTCATDTSQVQVALSAAIHTMVKNNIHQMGLS